MVSIQETHRDGEFTLELVTAVIIHTSRTEKTSEGEQFPGGEDL